jgi:hypothetical protein
MDDFKISAYTQQYQNKANIYALSGIRTHDYKSPHI